MRRYALLVASLAAVTAGMTQEALLKGVADCIPVTIPESDMANFLQLPDDDNGSDDITNFPHVKISSAPCNAQDDPVCKGASEPVDKNDEEPGVGGPQIMFSDNDMDLVTQRLYGIAVLRVLGNFHAPNATCYCHLTSKTATKDDVNGLNCLCKNRRMKPLCSLETVWGRYAAAHLDHVVQEARSHLAKPKPLESGDDGRPVNLSSCEGKVAQNADPKAYGDSPVCSTETNLHNVRCCGLATLHKVAFINNIPMSYYGCGQGDGQGERAGCGKCSLKSFCEAVDICEAAGLRLCSNAELKNGSAALNVTNDCGFGNTRIWTSDGAGTDMSCKPPKTPIPGCSNDPCKNACLMHGVCLCGKCVCEPGLKGEDCSVGLKEPSDFKVAPEVEVTELRGKGGPSEPSGRLGKLPEVGILSNPLFHAGTRRRR